MSFMEVMQLVGALVVIVLVLVCTYYGSRWYAKRMGGSLGAGKYIRVVDRASLAQGSAVYIVQIAGTYYLLGVGDKQVTLLGVLEDFQETETPRQTSGIPFSRLMRGLIEKEPPEDRGHGNYRDDGGDR